MNLCESQIMGGDPPILNTKEIKIKGCSSDVFRAHPDIKSQKMEGSDSDDFRAHPNINYKKVKGFSSDDFRAHQVMNYQKMKGLDSDDIRAHPHIKSQNRNNERFPHNTKRKIKRTNETGKIRKTRDRALPIWIIIIILMTIKGINTEETKG